jgi:hypothetical protein
MRKKSIVIALLLVTFASVVAIVNQRSIRVSYHRYQMQRNYDAAFTEDEDLGGGFRGFMLGASYDAFEYHRDALVTLGEVHANKYFLNHLVPGTEEKRHFWKMICLKDCPGNIYIVGERDDVGKPWPMTVWCWPNDTAKWNEYIAARDTASYAEDFMGGESVDSR